MSLKKWQHLKIIFTDIKLATKNFEKCIGKGGYGDVYYGELSINGKLTQVAVKRLNEQFEQGLKEFLTEIELLSGQEHQNLISLIGYCDEGTEKILVYEYAERGSLDRFIIRSNTNSTTLTWMERLKICVDAARGLDHLHNRVGEHQTIIHRDIKSANILIDENLVAKISDLGLSKLSLAGLGRSAVVTFACGTLGYVEPEYLTSGVLKKESDVYSFGVVLFEVLCGKLCNTLYDDDFVLSATSAKGFFEKGKLEEIVDPSVRKQMSLVSMERFSTIAYRCLQDRKQRPPMDLVVKELEKSLKLQKEYEFEKEDKLKSSRVKFGTDEYWKSKLPKDIENIMKKLNSRPSYSSSRELYLLLRKGILFDNGLRVLSITKDGKKCETVHSKAFLKWKPPRKSGDFGYGQDFLDKGIMYPHTDELNLHCQISTSMLSLNTTYAARLILSFGDWDAPVTARWHAPNFVWIKWQCQDLRVSSAHLVEETKNALKFPFCSGKGKTTLWHFVNNDKNAYFDIVINRILGSKVNDIPFIIIHGIEFQPLDMNKQHNGNEGIPISDDKVDWAKNMPSDYQGIIDRSDTQLAYTTEEELYFLLCDGILIDNGGKWFSICKSTGGKCIMLPTIKILSNDTDHNLVDRLSLPEARFKEVIQLHGRANLDFKCEFESGMLLDGKQYSCYLVFKFLDGYNTPNDACLLTASSISNGIRSETYAHLKLCKLVNTPIIKPTKKIQFRDPWSAPKAKVSLFPKWCIDGKQNNFMEKRNVGWMEVLLFEYLDHRHLHSKPFEVKLSCVEGPLNGFIMEGIEFRPM